MKDRPIRIDREKCNGCSVCVHNCPLDVLGLDEAMVAYAKYPDDCWYCGACEVECSSRAITVTFPYLIL